MNSSNGRHYRGEVSDVDSRFLKAFNSVFSEFWDAISVCIKVHLYMEEYMIFSEGLCAWHLITALVAILDHSIDGVRKIVM